MSKAGKPKKEPAAKIAAEPAKKVPEFVRSAGHVCLHTAEDGREWEFYVDASGSTLYKVPPMSPIEPRSGVREFGAMACQTGAWHILQTCRKFGCRVPDATARRLAEQEARASGFQTSAAASNAGSQPAQRKGDRTMKGKSGKSIRDMWDELFQENEKRAKSGKPWTDAQLVEKMLAEFPNAKGGKTTLTRPRMFRSHYNHGNFTFENLGDPKKRRVPHSWEYDAKGEKVEPGSRHGDGKPKKGKTSASAKPKKSGKKVVRKAKRASSDKVSMAEHDRKRRAAAKKGKKGKKVAKVRAAKPAIDAAPPAAIVAPE